MGHHMHRHSRSMPDALSEIPKPDLCEAGTPDRVAHLVVDKQGRPAVDTGFEGTVLLWHEEALKCAMDLSHDFEGEQMYILHCHILEQETAMMLNVMVI